MNRKTIERLKRSFERRGGAFEIRPDAPPEIMRGLLEGLLACPDCRAAVLEACDSDDRKNVDIDAVLRDLAKQDGH
jgi:hypothetical protein